MIGRMKLIALAWLAPLLVLAVACRGDGPGLEATRAPGEKVATIPATRCPTVIPIDNDDIPPGVPSPTAYFPNGTPTADGTPHIILRRATAEEEATSDAKRTITAAADPFTRLRAPIARSTSCAEPRTSATPAVTDASP